MSETTRKEFVEKYGDIVLTFSSYYKYTFTYGGDLPDGGRISASIGGDADEIYRLSVANGEEMSVRGLDPYAGTIHKNGECIESFYDY